MPIAILMVAIAGTTMWFIFPALLIGYTIGLALGITLTVLALRKLGRRSKKSLFASQVFHRLTKYKAAVYHIQVQQPKSVSATIYGDGHDYADIVDILKNMKFPTNTAKEAAKYAVSEVRNESLEAKITEALKYLDGNGNRAKIT